MTAQATGVVRFWLRGSVRELPDARPTQSVLHWLRESGLSPGTKEGCNAGDCGACTVVLAERADDGTGMRLRTANSCLLLVPRLHGRALFTVEDVGDVDALHPVQAAMVAAGGSQCGFCTPGFVMSLWHGLETRRDADGPPTRDELAGMLTGNLCRCTGYRPILDAALTAAAAAPARSATADLLERAAAALDTLAGEAAVTGGPSQPLSIAGPTGTYLAPTTGSELLAALAEHPDARILAGGTDLVPALRLSGDELRDDLVLVSVADVPDLCGVRTVGDRLLLGAATSLEDAWTALDSRLPQLRRMHERFASPGIRGVGTVGGNLANASPVADLVPVLIALDADVVLLGGGGERVLPVADVATGVRRTVLGAGEVVARVEIPLASFARDLRAAKVSRRFDDDISAVSGTFAARTDAAGTLQEVRAVFGGMATTVRRAAAVEAALEGRPWNEAAREAAVAALAQDFTPIDDHRAGASYRLRVAAALLRRWWHETSPEAPMVPYDVWADA